MPRHLLDIVVKAISQMDVPALRSLLSEAYTYQNATKEVFITKISEQFDRFRAAGDTLLIPSAGKCSSENCDNCGRLGFRFIGNKSRNYLSFIFEKQNEDLTDIFSCRDFRTEKDEVLAKEYDLLVLIDEEAGFKKDMGFHILLSDALEAMEVINQLPNLELSFDFLKSWILQYENSFSKMDKRTPFFFNLRWSTFLVTYRDCAKIYHYFEKSLGLLKTAAAELPDEQDEEAVIKWILSWSQLFNELYEIEDIQLFDLLNNDEKRSFRLVGEPFGFYNKLYNQFTAYNDRMLDKYSIYTHEEMNYHMEQDEEFLENMNNLAFHLEQRSKAREIGVEYRLYPNGTPDGQDL
jgi:hypothetical protein